MTLVKKGSRVLDIDGVSYRWRLRGRPTYSQVLGSPMTFAVELEDEPGSTLVVTTNQPHLSVLVGRPGTPILPSHVTRAVRMAKERGWQPETTGKPVMLDLFVG